VGDITEGHLGCSPKGIIVQRYHQSGGSERGERQRREEEGEWRQW